MEVHSVGYATRRGLIKGRVAKVPKVGCMGLLDNELWGELSQMKCLASQYLDLDHNSWLSQIGWLNAASWQCLKDSTAMLSPCCAHAEYLLGDPDAGNAKHMSFVQMIHVTTHVTHVCLSRIFKVRASMELHDLEWMVPAAVSVSSLHDHRNEVFVSAEFIYKILSYTYSSIQSYGSSKFYHSLFQLMLFWSLEHVVLLDGCPMLHWSAKVRRIMWERQRNCVCNYLASARIQYGLVSDFHKGRPNCGVPKFGSRNRVLLNLPAQTRIPVTVLTGVLGAGKTTLLRLGRLFFVPTSLIPDTFWSELCSPKKSMSGTFWKSLMGTELPLFIMSPSLNAPVRISTDLQHSPGFRRRWAWRRWHSEPWSFAPFATDLMQAPLFTDAKGDTIKDNLLLMLWSLTATMFAFQVRGEIS